MTGKQTKRHAGYRSLIRSAIQAATLIIAAVLLSILLLSCGGEGGTGTTAGSSGPASEPETSAAADDGALILGGGIPFTVIRGDKAPQAVVRAASALYAELSSSLNIENVGIKEDFVIEQRGSDSVVTDGYEIVIGETNRAGTKETVGMIEGQGCAMRIVGKTLVITGTDIRTTIAALNRFKKEILENTERTSDGKIRILPSDCFIENNMMPLQYSEILSGDLKYTVSLKEVIHCLPVGDYHVAQGAATDGKYAYFALRQSGDGNAVICKYELATGERVAVSDPIYCGHANDMTYDSAKGLLYIAHGQSEGTILTLVDAGTLQVTKQTQGIPKGSGAITYSVSRDIIAISQGGTTLHFLNPDFSLIRSLSRIKPGYTAQGMGSDEDFIYFPMSGSADNILDVYDWEGEHVGVITLPIKLESESMFWYGGNYYVNFYESGNGAKLYSLEFIEAFE